MSILKNSNSVHPNNGLPVVTQQPQPSAGAVDAEPPRRLQRQFSQELRTAKAAPVGSACPKGLEGLVGLEHLFVKQSQLQVEFFVDAVNKYEVLDAEGELVFLAAETTTAPTRIFCFGGYPFDVAVNTLPNAATSTYSWNAKGKEVLQLRGSGGSCGCGAEVVVSMDKKTLGSVEQEGDCTRPSYVVRNADRRTLLLIQGPEKPNCCSCGFGAQAASLLGSADGRPRHRGSHPGAPMQLDLIQFELLLPETKLQVGRIARQHVAAPPVPQPQSIKPTGKAQGPRNLQQRRESVQHLTRTKEHELWGLRFNRDLEPSTKALLLSAVYLLEFQYYDI